jgi:hypothetical protein
MYAKIAQKYSEKYVKIDEKLKKSCNLNGAGVL